MPGNNSQHVSHGGVPHFIKCSVCGKEKDSRKQFSNKAINNYREFHKNVRPVTKALKKNAQEPKSLYIRCKACTGGQIQEITCCICRQTKAINRFSLAQKADPDNARCKECMRAIELVLPASSKVDNPEEDDGPSMPRRFPGERDHFHKDVPGQYWTDHDGDASSVSNPWSSHAGSEYGSRGPISSRESVNEFDDDGDDDASSIVSSSTMPVPAKHGGQSGGLTMEKLATLDKQLQNLNVESGMPIKSLLYGSKGQESTVDGGSETDSNKSDVTVKKDRGVPLSVAALSHATSVSQVSRVPQYDDDDVDDEYDNVQLLQPVMKKTTTDLYDDDDDGEYDDFPFSPSAGNDYNRDPSVAGESQDGYGSHLSGTEVFGSSSSSAYGSHRSGPSSSAVSDWNGRSHTSKMVASGFKENSYKKAADANNPRKFARVRPNNMRTVDMDKSFLHKTYHTENAGRKKSHGGVESDED